MPDYYSQKLSGERLRRCYELAPPRVRQYLDAEIEFVSSRLAPGDAVLEAGCGYGRVMAGLAGRGTRIVGIDTALDSLHLARRLLAGYSDCCLAAMNAVATGFRDASFDTVICLQNGLAAFGIPPELLLREALRVTRPGGRAIFSSYSTDFWPDRLHWFELQAQAGLVGAIDREATGGNVIVCTDGFRAGIVTASEFRILAERLGAKAHLTEVDRSSLFCEFTS